MSTSPSSSSIPILSPPPSYVESIDSHSSSTDVSSSSPDTSPLTPITLLRIYNGETTAMSIYIHPLHSTVLSLLGLGRYPICNESRSDSSLSEWGYFDPYNESWQIDLQKQRVMRFIYMGRTLKVINRANPTNNNNNNNNKETPEDVLCSDAIGMKEGHIVHCYVRDLEPEEMNAINTSDTLNHQTVASTDPSSPVRSTSSNNNNNMLFSSNASALSPIELRELLQSHRSTLLDSSQPFTFHNNENGSTAIVFHNLIIADEEEDDEVSEHIGVFSTDPHASSSSAQTLISLFALLDLVLGFFLGLFLGPLSLIWLFWTHSSNREAERKQKIGILLGVTFSIILGVNNSVFRQRNV